MYISINIYIYINISIVDSFVYMLLTVAHMMAQGLTFTVDPCHQFVWLIYFKKKKEKKLQQQ